MQNNIIILLVDFNNQLVKLEQYDDTTFEIENIFQIIYPNKMQFVIGNITGEIIYKLEKM